MSWSVPNMWPDGECWIIGGGPSIPVEFGIPNDVVTSVRTGEQPPSIYSSYMQAIHNKHVIGINMSFLFGPWVDIVFFGDKRWYLANRNELANFNGLKITCHPHLNNHEARSQNIKHLQRDNNKPRGISTHKYAVSWNANSGAAAISVAANAGAKRIILVGFDMSLSADNKNQHWHNMYKNNNKIPEQKKLPFHRHLIGFAQIASDAKKRNIEIINASPNSKITQFKKRTVKELLNA